MEWPDSVTVNTAGLQTSMACTICLLGTLPAMPSSRHQVQGWLVSVPAQFAGKLDVQMSSPQVRKILSVPHLPHHN